MKIHFHKKSHRHGVEAKTEENIYRRGAEFAETKAFIHKNPYLCALSVSAVLFPDAYSHKRRKGAKVLKNSFPNLASWLENYPKF